MLLDLFKSVLRDPPPAMVFEISEAGIASARIGSKTELAFQPLKSGTLAVSPVKDNVVDSDELVAGVRTLARVESRKRRDAAVILPDYSARMSVLDFDSFPTDAAQQLSLVRFRLKRSVPFDVDSAAVSFWAQPADGKHIDVMTVVAPLEIVARYEAPFRAVGLNPGFVTTSALAALELAPESELSVVVKLAGRVLTVLVRKRASLKLVRCLELPTTELEDIAAVLLPTWAYVEDNLGAAPETLLLCGFGGRFSQAAGRFAEELGVTVEPLRSPLATPGELDAGLLGYLHSVGRDN